LNHLCSKPVPVQKAPAEAVFSIIQ